MKFTIWVKMLLLATFYNSGIAESEEKLGSLEKLPSPLGLKSPTPRKPTITEHPSSTIVQGSDVVRLDCRADGYPNPIITWRRNNMPLTNLTERRIVEMNPGGLIFISVSSKGKWPNTGTYQCIAKNDLGTAVSRNASVQIANIRDDFRREPSDTIAAVGRSTAIQCEGPRGIPEPFISWKKDSQPVRNTSRVQILPSGDLFISRLEMSDSGSYECVASNIAGVKISHAAYLMVQEPPTVVVSPSTLIARVGKSAEVFCQVNGNPVPRMWWSKNGEALSDRFVVSNVGVMRIGSIELQDEGEYICTAENGVGRVSGSVSVTVQAEPVIVEVIPDNTMQVGETVTLPCRAEGSPRPTIVWRDQHGNEMFVEKSYQDGHVLIDANGDLVLFSARLKDAGMYRCQAVNTIGTAMVEVQLNVLPIRSSGPPPQLNHVPTNKTAPLKSTVVLQCSSQGNPRPIIEWWKDSKLVETGSSRPRITILHSGSLKITNLQSTDAGLYTCKATNNYGFTEWRAWIKIGAVILDQVRLPSVPGKPVFVNSTSSTITLSWTPAKYDDLTDHYIIEYYRVESSSSSWKRVTPVLRSVYKVEHLLPSSSYVFSVRSANRGGVSGPSSHSEYVRTKDPDLSNSPAEDRRLDTVLIHVTQAFRSDTGSATLMWNSSSGCDVIDGFMVIAQATTSSENSITKKVACNLRSSQLNGLEYGQKYEVRVRPLKGLRAGPASPITFVSLSEGIVSPKLPVLSIQISENKVKCKWQHPDDLPATYVTGYAIRYHTRDGAVDQTLHVNASTTQITLDDLRSGAMYYATLTYSTQLGIGTSSKEETIIIGTGPGTTNDLATILTQPAVIAGIAGALVLIIVVIIVVIYCCKKSKRASKTRSSSRRGDLSSFGNDFVMTSANQREQSRNMVSNDNGMFPSEQIPMISAASHMNSGSSVSYNAKNGEVTSNISNNPPGVAHPTPTNFSYVTDQLINKNDIHPHFSRPNVSSSQQVTAYPGQRQPHFCDRQQNVYSNMRTPQDEQNNGYTDPPNMRYEAFPSPPSPPLSHRTGISDKSRSSSGIRSTSDRSNKSGQSSRRQVSAIGISNNRATEATNRLHGSQHPYEHGFSDETSHFAPPTPPIREESFHGYTSSNNQHSRNSHSNLKLEQDPKICADMFPSNYNQTRSNAKAMNLSLGNGYGSESDIRESSCEHDSTPLYSSDESVNMESVSQVGQNHVQRTGEGSYLYSPLASQHPNVSPSHPTSIQYHNDQGALLPAAPPEAPNCSRAQGIGNSTASSKETEVYNQNHGEMDPQNHGLANSEMPRHHLAANNQQNRQFKNAPALKLEINGALNKLQIQNGDYPSPSSPTESAVSEQSGYMSTASSCWQFHLSSPTKTSSQLRNAKINSNGRLPSMPRPDKQHTDFNDVTSQPLINKDPFHNPSVSNYASTPNYHNGMSQFQNAKLRLAGKVSNTYPNERPENRTLFPITTISEFSEDPINERN